MSAGRIEWSVELVDRTRLGEFLGFIGAPENDVAHSVDRLISILDERGVLSRAALGVDRPWWEDRTKSFAVWRLAEPTSVWRARARNDGSELVIIRNANDVLVVSPASALNRRLPAEYLLTSDYTASKSEPYALAESALNRALLNVGGDLMDLGRQDPRTFDAHFRGQPEAALVEVGFDLSPMLVDRYLVRLQHLFDLTEDFFDRPLPRHDPIGYGELVALWSRAPGVSTGRPVVLVLLSIEDEPTKRLRPHLQHAADLAGYDLVVLFAIARYGSSPTVDPVALDEQLERAWFGTAGAVKALVVHDGVAFAYNSSAYRNALAALRSRHPEIRLATEALLGARGGEVHGVGFDQPPELDPILEQLAF